ncbi:unnamed protein product, partial [Ixodes pacificus]
MTPQSVYGRFRSSPHPSTTPTRSDVLPPASLAVLRRVPAPLDPVPLQVPRVARGLPLLQQPAALRPGPALGFGLWPHGLLQPVDQGTRRSLPGDQSRSAFLQGVTGPRNVSSVGRLGAKIKGCSCM